MTTGVHSPRVLCDHSGRGFRGIRLLLLADLYKKMYNCIRFTLKQLAVSPESPSEMAAKNAGADCLHSSGKGEVGVGPRGCRWIVKPLTRGTCPDSTQGGRGQNKVGLREEPAHRQFWRRQNCLAPQKERPARLSRMSLRRDVLDMPEGPR